MLKRVLCLGVLVLLAGCLGGGPSGAGPVLRGIGRRKFPGSKEKVFAAAVDACIQLDMYVVSVDGSRMINAIAPGRVAGETVLVNISFIGPENVTRVAFYNIEEGSEQASILRTRIFDAISRKLGRAPPKGREEAILGARRG